MHTEYKMQHTQAIAYKPATPRNTVIVGAISVCLAALVWLTSPVRAADLAGSEWQPTAIGTLDVPPDADIFVRFGGEGKLQGHAGCNGFFGSYELTGDTISMGPFGATRMACPEPVMQREFEFLQALENAHRFTRDRTLLTLVDTNNNPVLTFRQRDAD